MAETRWTPEQAAAICAEGHTVLRANAGTGKTTTVIGRILWHLGLPVGVERSTDKPLAPCPPERRLDLPQFAAITFTEKAAYDLKRKLREALHTTAPHLVWELDRAAIGTIHGFCADLLKEHALRFGIDPGFRILDERDARLEQDRICRDVAMDALEKRVPEVVEITRLATLDGYRHTSGLIDLIRTAFRDLRWHRERYDTWCTDGRLDESVMRRLADTWSEEDQQSHEQTAALVALAHDVAVEWQRFEQQERVRDFDSLILTVRDILQSERGSSALDGIRRRFRLLIIDEFQDTDGAQRDIAFAIAGIARPGDASTASGPELFVVGDPKQSIYGFRGADIGVWNGVTQVVCDGEPLQLTENFRSHSAVIGFVNAVCAAVMNEEAEQVRSLNAGSEVPYTFLTPARVTQSHDTPAEDTALLEWLQTPAGSRSEERRNEEAERVAARIRDIVIDADKGDHDGIRIPDPDTGVPRDCAYRDVAILFRTRTGLDAYEHALEQYGVPYYLSGDAGLVEQQEVLDLLTLLRVIDNPRDDLRMFAFLRSPWVGLRDETITRIRLDGKPHTLLQQARRYLNDNRPWSPFPSHEEIETLERDALRIGIEVLDDLVATRTRVAIDQLVQEALDRTGYRLHLYLLDHPAARMANVQRVMQLLEGYRHHTVGSFLEMWQKWEGQDLGLPQAPLYSKRDNVVTLSTIHAAKGLEWPVVFLVDCDSAFRDGSTGTLVTDRELGPLFCPKKDERGLRAQRIANRKLAEERAEEARLLYVAMTRARDRLIVSGPTEGAKGVQEWIARHRGDGLTITSEVPDVARPALPAEAGLGWLSTVVQGGGASPLTRNIPLRHPRRFRSATELMTRRRNRREWKMKYVHGVIPKWQFAAPEGDAIPANVRGVIVHDVLERLREEHELAELIDLAVATLDEPDLEERLGPGSEYRAALEEEIRRVVASDDWHWYVAGEHYRELWFAHVRPSGRWRVGAFDLFRADDRGDRIIDFKTHDIDASEAVAKAEEYAIQAAMYRSAVLALRGDASVTFHFTKPNVAVDADASREITRRGPAG